MWDIETYTNREVIAVSQDPLVSQGSEFAPGVWARTLHDGGLALVMANRDLLDLFGHKKVTCDASCWAKTPFAPGTNLTVRDLWAHGPPPEAGLRRITVPEPFTLQIDDAWSSRAFKLSVA